VSDLFNEISIRISGENGDGIFSSGDTLAKICSRSGLEVHASRAYQSIIRGGHVSYSIRASNQEVRAPADYIELLVALRKDSFIVDAIPTMTKGGFILFDSKGSRIKDEPIPSDVELIDIPALELARKLSPLKILRNTVFVGAAIALYSLKLEYLEEIIHEAFDRKGEEVVNINIDAARAGYEWVLQNCKLIDHNVKLKDRTEKVFIGGNEALALGLLAGGLQSYSWYPMTPATPVGAFLAKYGPNAGCVVKQMEDEINVANFAVGAGFAGARSACATSGGGFALMTEAIGFASIIEAPVVFIEVARGGPSTGLPTKTEQGDLNQLLGASQGDFPRAIIAQTTIEDGFYLGQESLNIAEKYQIPVLIASDLYLGEHFETIPELDFEKIPIERGKLILEEIPVEEQPYLRYKLTEDGISPRAIPGVKGGEHDAGSDEHDEDGKLVSDRRAGFPEAIQVRIKQMNKRMGKMDLLLTELPPPQVESNADHPDILIVGWGSSYDVINEARADLLKVGIKSSQLHLKYILPFHAKEVKEILEDFESKQIPILMVEANYTGQMARHIRAETGFLLKHKYLRFDGEYILPREIGMEVKKLLNKE